MSFSTGGSSCQTNDNLVRIDNFFNDVESPNTNPPIPPRLESASKCSSWINAQRFEQLPAEESSNNGDVVDLREKCSPLSESVFSSNDLQRNLERKRRQSKNITDRQKEKRSKNETQNFFQKAAQAQNNFKNNSDKFVKVDDIWFEKATQEEISESRTTTKFDEVMALFERNPRKFDVITFQFSYKFDWERYSKHKMQFIVFTKICRSHPEGHLVEMRKEHTKCQNCGSTDLAVSVRLTLPLDLSDISIPCFEDIQIHVAFPINQILKNSEKSTDFSDQNCEKMLNSLCKMIRDRRSDRVYQEWFQKCKMLIEKSFKSKRVQLHVGRVVREKIEKIDGIEKKRCFLFASIFDLH